MWSMPRIEVKFRSFPTRYYAYIKVLDVWHDIPSDDGAGLQNNPNARSIYLLHTKERQAKNTLRHSRAWKPNHNSLRLKEASGVSK